MPIYTVTKIVNFSSSLRFSSKEYGKANGRKRSWLHSIPLTEMLERGADLWKLLYFALRGNNIWLIVLLVLKQQFREDTC